MNYFRCFTVLSSNRSYFSNNWLNYFLPDVSIISRDRKYVGFQLIPHKVVVKIKQNNGQKHIKLLVGIQQMLVNSNNHCLLLYSSYVTYGQRKPYMSYVEFLFLIYAILEKYKTYKLLNVLSSTLFSQSLVGRDFCLLNCILLWSSPL